MPDPILDADKATKLQARKDEFNRSINTNTESLLNGRITLNMWEEDFRTRLRLYMTGSAMIGKGDPTEMTPSDWGKVGAELKKQYRWLHGFAADIDAQRDTISAEAIGARSRLYGEAGSKIATEIQARYFAPNTRRDPVNVLPWIPKDGSTVCMNGCQCRWILEPIGQNDGVQTIQATWMLGVAEHCVDCIPREGHTEIVEIPVGEDIPEFIGV